MTKNSYKIIGILLLQSVFWSGASFASDTASIENTSIQFEDAAAKSRLLASVPAWQTESIKIVFDAYLHPEQYQYPREKQPQHKMRFLFMPSLARLIIH